MGKQFNAGNETTRLRKKVRNFLQRRGTITFSGRTLLHQIAQFRFYDLLRRKARKNKDLPLLRRRKLKIAAPGAFIGESEYQYYGTSASFLQTENKGKHFF
jgi:DNA-directed RNA polymerase specialized sigma24 family protein